MTQQEKLLKMLREKEWVSTMDCINNYMLRASDLVMKLRRKGYKIIERKKAGQQFGEYHLEERKIILPPAFPPKKKEASRLL